jgi:type II secretion system protein C
MLAALLVLIGVLAPPLASSCASAEVSPASQAAPADLEALGVIVNPRSGGSVAILRSGARTRVVALGETAFGGRVAAIGERSVWLDFGGARVEVRLPVASAERVAAAAAVRADPLEDPETPAREMARDEVQRRLALETPRILTETTLVPVQDEQRVTGFALTRIPEGSLLSDAGLRPGDVLTAVNDVPIDSLATLMGLWPRLQNESRVNALVLRDGRPVSLTVTLR